MDQHLGAAAVGRNDGEAMRHAVAEQPAAQASVRAVGTAALFDGPRGRFRVAVRHFGTGQLAYVTDYRECGGAEVRYYFDPDYARQFVRRLAGIIQHRRHGEAPPEFVGFVLDGAEVAP